MIGDRPGEGVLRVGVDVHLHDAVVECLADLAQQRARATVEDEVERLVLAVLRPDGTLDVVEDRRGEDDVARLVDAVDVAKGRRDHVTAALAEAECLGGGDAVFDRREQFGVVLRLDAVLLAADNADLDLKDDVRLDAGVEHAGCDLEVLLERHCRAIPHVRLEQRLEALGDALLRDRDEGLHEAGELLLRAVVGVEGDVDVVVLRDRVGELGESGCAGDHVLDRLAGRELGAAPRDLDDAVRLGLGEAADCRDDGL